MTADPPEEQPVALPLRDGGSVVLGRDAVLAAARDAPDGRPDRAAVLVDGRAVSILELVAGATGRSTTEIPLRRAVDALHRLGFTIAGERPAAPSARRRGTNGPPDPAHRPGHDGPAPAGTTDDTPQSPPLDLAAVRALRRYTGQWVALRGRRVVASGPTLHDVVTRAGATEADPVTVLQVPPPPAAR